MVTFFIIVFTDEFAVPVFRYIFLEKQVKRKNDFISIIINGSFLLQDAYRKHENLKFICIFVKRAGYRFKGF